MFILIQVITIWSTDALNKTRDIFSKVSHSNRWSHEREKKGLRRRKPWMRNLKSHQVVLLTVYPSLSDTQTQFTVSVFRQSPGGN